LLEYAIFVRHADPAAAALAMRYAHECPAPLPTAAGQPSERQPVSGGALRPCPLPRPTR
jgi:hypothetical protein